MRAAIDRLTSVVSVSFLMLAVFGLLGGCGGATGGSAGTATQASQGEVFVAHGIEDLPGRTWTIVSEPKNHEHDDSDAEKVCSSVDHFRRDGTLRVQKCNGAPCGAQDDFYISASHGFLPDWTSAPMRVLRPQDAVEGKAILRVQRLLSDKDKELCTNGCMLGQITDGAECKHAILVDIDKELQDVGSPCGDLEGTCLNSRYFASMGNVVRIARVS